MKRLLISFIFSILTANSAYATATEAKTDHAIKLIQTFEADKVDHVINSSVSNFICNEGTNSQIDNERKVDFAGSRAPGFVKGKGKFQLFKEEVEKENFRKRYYNEGDIYSYSTQEEKAVEHFLFSLDTVTYEHVFNRYSEAKNTPFEHEFGLTVADVKKGIMSLLENADHHYQTGEKAFSVQVKDKAYLIDLRYPLLANPIYKQDVKTGEIEYGYTGATPRYGHGTSIVSMGE